MSLTAALRLIEASLATAMSYLTVVWGLILGYLFFSEVPGVWSLLGAAVVCSTTTILGWDERRQHKSKLERSQPPTDQTDSMPAEEQQSSAQERHV